MPTHRPFVSVVIFYISGILLHCFIPIPLRYLLLMMVLCFMLNVIFFGKERLSKYILLISFLCLGALNSFNYQDLPSGDVSHIAKFYRNNPIELRGLIVSDVNQKYFLKSEKRTFLLKVESSRAPWGWVPQSGRVLVNSFHPNDVRYGDRIEIEGKLHKPFNFLSESNFSYREYLSNKGIHYLLSVKKKARLDILERDQGAHFYAELLSIKKKLKKVIEESLSPNEAAVVVAMILGDRTEIPNHIQSLFERTGTIHILAISGMNVGFVAALILLMLKMFPLKHPWPVVITIFLLTAYALLTGAMPSVVRATIMAVVFLVSFMMDKDSDPINTLSLSGFILLCLNPMNLFDVGFQLSFVCVLFILLFYPFLFALWKNFMPSSAPKIMDWIGQSLSVSLAAWVGVAGFIAYYFQLVTPITVLANLIVVPLSSLIVYVGFGLVAAGLFCPAIGFLFSYSIKFLLNLLVGVVYVFDQCPGAYVYLPATPVWAWAIYYSLIFVVFYGCRIRFKKVKNHGIDILL